MAITVAAITIKWFRMCYCSFQFDGVTDKATTIPGFVGALSLLEVILLERLYERRSSL